MTYKLQKKSVKIGKHTQFELDPDTTATVVGLVYFELSYGGDTDHHIDEIKIRLLPSRQGDTLSVHVTATMDDASGHRLKAKESKVIVACISTTNGIDQMTNAVGIGGISGDARTITFDVPRTNTRGVQGAASFISGYDLSYGQSDHHVREISCITAFNPTALSGGTVYAQSEMKDSSGNSAITTTTNAGVLIAAGPSEDEPGSPLMIALAPDIQFKKDEVSFGQEVGEAIALISDFVVDYGTSDHHVKKIAVGAPESVKIEGSTVKLTGKTGAEMKDNSGHSEKSSVSGVAMTVLAIPAS